jgi:hypothetical protein
MPDRVFPVFRAVAAIAAVMTLTAGPLGSVLAQTGASRFALVTVSDNRGKALVDITADDFVVEEAGATREILDVRVADYPIAVVIDTGAAADFPSIRAAVTRFIERLGPRPIALLTTAPPAIVATFEDERETVQSRLTASDPSAGSRPLRAASLAASAIRATGTLFSSVIVVTATTAEVTGPEADDLVAPIIDSGAVVHVIAKGTEGTVIGGGGLLLRGLAQQMHGDFTAVYAAPSYQPALDRLATRLTTELMVEYIVPVGSKATDVKIGIRVPGARVRGLGVAPK